MAGLALRAAPQSSGARSPLLIGVLLWPNPENPKNGTRDKMLLKVECVVDSGMHAEEALGRAPSSWRLVWAESAMG
jgi:hypothetical protein